MDARVVIVGAGPAGALLAYLLSSRGIETLLVERHSDFEREFRGEVLMPSGVRALTDAGFSLDRVSTSAPETLEGYLNGRPFFRVSSDQMDAPRPTAVSQPELLEALVALSERTGNFQLRRGTTIRGLARDESGSLSLRLKITGVDREEILRAPFVIGADGRGSIVRRQHEHRVRTRSAPLDIVWFKMPYPTSWREPRARFELGHGHLMIVLQAPDGLLQAAWLIVKGAYGDLKAREMAEWADEMSLHTDPELAEHLVRHRDQISRPFLLKAVTDRVLGWSSPSTLLIGDAAHTMSPVGGQGINLALRDAIVAANELVPALRGNGDLAAAGARIEKLRGPEIDLIQRLAALPPRLVMGRTPLHEMARRALARLAGTRIAQARAARGISLFLDGVTKVELTV